MTQADQSYLRDHRALKVAPVDDGYMQFRAADGATVVRAGSEVRAGGEVESERAVTSPAR